MNIDLEKIQRIGIDWLSIYNFEIEDSNGNKIIQEVEDKYISEKIRIDEELFSIETSKTLYADSNHITEFKKLRFNPNRILFGNNINNTQGPELLESISELKKILSHHGIIINFENAKISEIELNCNFNKEFEELKETFSLMFIDAIDANLISNRENKKSYKKMFKGRTIQCNYGRTLATAYDKTKQINDEILLSEPISRLEWRFLKGSINKYFVKRGMESTLENVINNFHILEEIFKEHTMLNLVDPAMEHIKKRLKKNLEKDYLKFKSAAKFSRKNKLKEDRNVYKYLEEESWIFDKNFLIEIISKYDKAHKSREIKRIKDKYSHHNNLEKFRYLVGIIF